MILHKLSAFVVTITTAFDTFLSGLYNCLLKFNYFVNNIIRGGAKVLTGMLKISEEEHLPLIQALIYTS